MRAYSSHAVHMRNLPSVSSFRFADTLDLNLVNVLNRDFQLINLLRLIMCVGHA